MSEHDPLGLLNLFVPVLVGIIGGAVIYYQKKEPKRKDTILACLWVYFSPYPILFILDKIIPKISVDRQDILPLSAAYWLFGSLITVFIIRNQIRVSFISSNSEVNQQNNSDEQLKYICSTLSKVSIYTVSTLFYGGLFLTIAFSYLPTISQNLVFAMSVLGVVGFFSHVSFTWRLVRCPHCGSFVLHNIFSPLEDIQEKGKPPSIVLLGFLAIGKVGRCYCCNGQVKVK